MGYRSDVAIAIHKDVQGDFLTFLNTEKLMTQIFGDMSDFYLDKDFQDEGHWLFTADQIKWYADWADVYPEIQMFEKFMDAMEEDEGKRGKYRFIRIGEELEDMEHRGDWWDSNLHVRRSIQAGW